MDKVYARVGIGTAYERDDLVPLDELERKLGTDPVFHPEATLTLTSQHQGRLIVLTSACTITVPTDLPNGFSCGWAQYGTGVVTFIGTTIISRNDVRKSDGQYSLGAIAAMPDGKVWLYGELTT